MSLTQIVPRLPPSVDGVGDYAISLTWKLHKDYGYQTHFIVADSSWSGDLQSEAFSASSIVERSSAALLEQLNKGADTALLHYVGYGYERRGCPFWLVDGIERWREEKPHRTLITMFHEVYASGPIWTSSFWLSPWQKNLAGRLARLSNHCFTNRVEYADYICHLSSVGDKRVTVSPVFSNVGEPKEMPLPLTDRRRRLAVFGNRGRRRLVFQESLQALRHTCRALDIEEIIDIGAQVEHGISHLDNIPVVQTGVLPAGDVSALLSDSIAGFFNYPTDYLGKSTIFAAYCAHRLLPVATHASNRQVDGLVGGEHYWIANGYEGQWNLTRAQITADNAYSWYQPHTVSKQAEVFASRLMQRSHCAAAES